MAKKVTKAPAIEEILPPEAGAPPRYDYGELSEAVAETARLTAVIIRAKVSQTAESIIEIGRQLKNVHELLPHGEWLPWLRAEFSWSARTAQSFIRAADAFGDGANAKLISHLTPTALIKLAAAPEDARTAVIKLVNDGERPTVAIVNRVIKATRPVALPEVTQSQSSTKKKKVSAPSATMSAFDFAAEFDAQTIDSRRAAIEQLGAKITKLLADVFESATSIERGDRLSENWVRDTHNRLLDAVLTAAEIANRHRLTPHSLGAEFEGRLQTLFQEMSRLDEVCRPINSKFQSAASVGEILLEVRNRLAAGGF